MNNNHSEREQLRCISQYLDQRQQRDVRESEQRDDLAAICVSHHRLGNHNIMLPPELIRKKILFKECAVAGVSFHIKYNDEIWDELEVGTKVALVREKDNKYDKNAVAVALFDDYDGDPDDFDFDFILGYIPKTENEQIAQMFDMGWDDVFVAELTTVKKHGNINNRLRISIFIQSKEPEVVRPNLLRAESLSASELRQMVDELSERGTTYFRFGGFPHYELQYPDVGEKIVMIHRDINSEVLYLMRVLATDENCAQYVDDPDLIHCIDDCAPFILTNIMGPIRIQKFDYNFLIGVDLKGFSATEYLPHDVSSGFEKLFKNAIAETLNRNNIDCDPSIDNLEDTE